MKLSAPIHSLKRQAKLLARRQGVPLHRALDQTAKQNGFRSWSHLIASSQSQGSAKDLFGHLVPGDLMLMGARPGQGKTLLALNLALAAGDACFFTLDYSIDQVDERLWELGADSTQSRRTLQIDTSDEICAGYVISRLGAYAKDRLVVIDYLQVLDQKRIHPDIDAQVRELREFAVSAGAKVVVISQIDRSFDVSGRAMPELRDVRMPNPIDLNQFNKACFLHEGRTAFEVVGRH